MTHQGKDMRILMTRHKTSSILNRDLTGLSRWLTHEVKRQNKERETQVEWNFPWKKE
jgi:hypothetical protein